MVITSNPSDSFSHTASQTLGTDLNAGLPRASFESVQSNSSTASGLQSVAGAMEGWVRKITSGNGKGKQGANAWGIGDLIELEGSVQGDPADQDDDVGDGLDELGRPLRWSDELTPVASKPQDEPRGMTATEEALLREKFPLRGRKGRITKDE